MSSTYNARPLAPEVLVKGKRHAAVRVRQTLAELIGQDALAPWQGAGQTKRKGAR
jgi:diaminopimelate decarboxylase